MNACTTNATLALIMTIARIAVQIEQSQDFTYNHKMR